MTGLLVLMSAAILLVLALILLVTTEIRDALEDHWRHRRRPR